MGRWGVGEWGGVGGVTRGVQELAAYVESQMVLLCCGRWSVPSRTVAISVVLLDELFDLVQVKGEAARQKACSELRS